MYMQKNGKSSEDRYPASTLRIHNVAVWLLFGQVPFLRENYELNNDEKMAITPRRVIRLTSKLQGM